MTAPKGAGQWLLLSRWVTNNPSRKPEEAVSDLMKDLAADRYRYRYFNLGDRFSADDPPPMPMEEVTFEQAIGRGPRREPTPPPAPTPRSGHRYERLPSAFFREGRVNWLFSAVTFGESMILRLEIFFPYVTAEASAAPPAEVKIGRPSLKDRTQTEGRRLQGGGTRYKSCSAFARAVQFELKETVALRTLRFHLREVWINPK